MFTPRQLDAIADALRSDGCWWADDALDSTLVDALRIDLVAHRHALTEAAVGRGGKRQLDPGVRADMTLWLDGATAPQREFLDAMEQLRIQLNRALFLGLTEFETHYALYPPGAHYERHVDAFRTDATAGSSNRLLSTVFYLNEAWCDGDGGELQLWSADGRELLALPPRGGSAIIFLSDEFPHAVLPAQRERYSIAGWFRGGGGPSR